MGKKERDAKKAAKEASKAAEKGKKADKNAPAKVTKDTIKDGKVGGHRLPVLDHCTITGVLTSRVDSRDVKVGQVSIQLKGKHLFHEADLELTYGKKYGLIGANGSGKTTLLAAIAAREIPIPEHVDIWHLHEEAAPSDRSAIDAVVDCVRDEFNRLEALIEQLLEEDPEGNCDLVDACQDKLDRMDPSTFEKRAGELLFGLGFQQTMMAKKTKDMSGGWRMRVALAQALFVEPTLLLLDEPTNHLDLGACVWLEETLAKLPSTIILISHSQDFLNGVCTNIMNLNHKSRLEYWSGNYDQYIQTRTEKERNQMTKYQKEQDDILHIKKFIASCGTYANLLKQAQSKQKIIDKMVEAGLTEKPVPDPKYEFYFPSPGTLPPPVIAFHDVSFSYSGKKEEYLYAKLNFGIDLDSRIALVGPNGAGKSTLLKLICKDIEPVEGEIRLHSHLRIGRYNQHSAEVLPPNMTPLEFMMDHFKEGVISSSGKQKLSLEEWRSRLGRFGISGGTQTEHIATLSHGIQTRIVMAMIAIQHPHILLLDEPTNHLDMSCIDSLAEAINDFEGGLLLVSHDFRLINQVAKEIWICDQKTISPWTKDIIAYKKHLSGQMQQAAAKRLALQSKN
jgi:ATP-binding cassette subfamily F protein 2